MFTSTIAGDDDDGGGGVGSCSWATVLIVVVFNALETLATKLFYWPWS